MKGVMSIARISKKIFRLKKSHTNSSVCMAFFRSVIFFSKKITERKLFSCSFR